jgi:clan AA aspartic protease
VSRETSNSTGVFNAAITVRNPVEATATIELSAKVDTGATLLVLPQSVATELRLRSIRRQTVKYANEETAEREVVGVVELEVCGRKGWFEAVVEPRKTYALLGAVVMEALDLIVDPRAQRVYPNPRSKLPMAEIE